MLLKKFVELLFLTPPKGPLNRSTQRIFWIYHILVYKKVVLQHWCQNMIFPTINIRLVNKIWVLYLQNQASYVNFLFVKVMRNLNFEFFWNPEILLKFGDFWLIFCMWPLNIPSNKCYIAIWGQKWRFPWFLRGASEAPPWEPKNSIPHGR